MFCLFVCHSVPALFDEKLHVPCLGAYGKPVDPDTSLAGFTGQAYNNATTMIITFVVNNYQEESKMAEVMAWEKSFVEYMKVYTKDSSHANLTIHYSTPKNVQHKLRVWWWTYRDLAECDNNVIRRAVENISPMFAAVMLAKYFFVRDLPNSNKNNDNNYYFFS